jgi:putative glutamine amidotransferase
MASPTIGITSGRAGIPITEGVLESHYCGTGYVRAVAEAGGLPVLLASPPGREEAIATEVLAVVDGLVLSGGVDIDPAAYGGDVPTDGPDTSRDAFELALLAGAKDRGIPVLGVCRGMELINVGYGGTLRGGVEHRCGTPAGLDGLPGAREHRIPVEPGSRVRAALGVGSVQAVCLHHQAPDRIGEGLRVTARSEDGIPEALEDPDRWIVGVLWHPEQGLDRDPAHRRLYGALVAAARGEAR